MRKLRGLYTGLVYILATPALVLMTMLLLLLNIKHPAKAFNAWIEGLKLGHKSAMNWVKC